MIDQSLRQLLGDVLGLSEARTAALKRDTLLFGSLPELDSMAVAGLLTELEDRLGIIIDDEDIDGEMLASFGNLIDYVERKQAA